MGENIYKTTVLTSQKDTIIPKHLRMNGYNYLFNFDREVLTRIKVVLGSTELISKEGTVTLFINDHLGTLLLSSNSSITSRPKFNDRIDGFVSAAIDMVDTTICVKPIKFDVQSVLNNGHYTVKYINGPAVTEAFGEFDFGGVVKKGYSVHDNKLTSHDFKSSHMVEIEAGKSYPAQRYRKVLSEVALFIEDRIRAAAKHGLSIGDVCDEIY